MKVLLCPEVSQELFEQVKAVSPALNVVMASREAAAREAEDAEVFYGYHSDEIVKAGKKLKWIQSGSAGMDKFLSPALMDSDILICNASGLHAPQVAEHAWALTLGLCRGIPQYVRNQAERAWKGTPYMDLYGATAGIVGFGGIGKEYARRAHAFDMRIVTVDAHTKEKPAYVESLWGPERLNDLIRMSDVVFIAVPYTKETEKLINAERLSMMKPTAFLVNTARGPIVDEQALTAALKARQIAGAGLDVFEAEPLSKESELWGLDNVLITPHAAGSSALRPKRLMDFFCENLRRHLAGQPLMNVVDKKRGYPVREG
ncbi:MAG: D-2-hydroxyacid dehydrogenase [Candidatus Latescibacteria bacterium]|nr:D-2-hydroxyacid dehydrogenase [Candidatus Latescibacterota bacterium]